MFNKILGKKETTQKVYFLFVFLIKKNLKTNKGPEKSREKVGKYTVTCKLTKNQKFNLNFLVNSKGFICPICHLNFENQDVLFNHYSNIHQNGEADSSLNDEDCVDRSSLNATAEAVF